MRIKQISIFLENKSGRLSRVARVLGDNNINIRALSIADTTDFGILRLIVNDPVKAKQALKDAGLSVSTTDVIAVEIDDVPGGLAGVLDGLSAAGINIEYMYAFLTRASKAALMVFRVEQIEEAVKVLQGNGVTILSESQVYNL